MLKIIFISVTIIYFFLYIILAAKTKKPFKTIMAYSFLGVLGIIIINITARFSGIYIPINGYTLGCSAAFGLPGTVGILLLRMIFL